MTKEEIKLLLEDAEHRLDILQYNYIGNNPKTDFDKSQDTKITELRNKIKLFLKANYND